MTTKAIRTWQKIFDRHAAALKSIELSDSELKFHLKTLIELIGLRWSMRVKAPKLTDDLSNFVIPRASFSVPTPLEPKHLPREGGEETLWWDRKDRYKTFKDFAKQLIRRAADKHRLKSTLDEESSDLAYYKALAKMASKKVAWKVLPEDGTEKRFAASVLFILDPKGDLEKADKRSGGLSNLLAELEKALGLI